MTLKVVPFTSRHLASLEGRQEIEADVEYMLSTDMVAEYLGRGPAYTIMLGEEILWCGGLVMIWPGVAEAWGAPSWRIKERPKSFHRTVKQVLARLIETMRLRRVQCTVPATFGPSRKWVKNLGFRFEGKMPRYGQDGATHYRYAWVKRCQ